MCICGFVFLEKNNNLFVVKFIFFNVYLYISIVFGIKKLIVGCGFDINLIYYMIYIYIFNKFY